MERVVDVHVRHDFIAVLDQIIRALLCRDFRQPQVSLGINQPRINCHAGHINDPGISRNSQGGRRPDCRNLAVLDYEYAVFDCPVGHSQQLPALESDRPILGPRDRR